MPTEEHSSRYRLWLNVLAVLLPEVKKWLQGQYKQEGSALRRWLEVKPTDGLLLRALKSVLRFFLEFGGETSAPAEPRP